MQSCCIENVESNAELSDVPWAVEGKERMQRSCENAFNSRGGLHGELKPEFPPKQMGSRNWMKACHIGRC